MPYKYQGIGGGGPLPPMTRLVFGIVFCVIVCGYLAFVVYTFPSSPQPTAAEKFGCAKTYINARGEDTGECQ